MVLWSPGGVEKHMKIGKLSNETKFDIIAWKTQGPFLFVFLYVICSAIHYPSVPEYPKWIFLGQIIEITLGARSLKLGNM